MLPLDNPSVLDLFLALVQIDSPSYHEKGVADAVGQWLTAQGIEYTIDDAAAVTGCDTGNIIVRRLQDDTSPTLLFVAHMDTVQTVDQHIVPIVGDDGIVRSSGDTILGSDNKASVAALLHLLASDPPGNMVAVFSTCEEKGCRGITAIDDLVQEVDLAFPVDGSWPLGVIFTSSLGHLPFSVKVNGRAAHAAKEPEQGVHAVQAASRIVAEIQLGWQEESVANIGNIHGGGAANIIPDSCVIEGEIRGFSEEALEERIDAIGEVIHQVAVETGADIEFILHTERKIPPFPKDDNPVGETILRAAATQVGLQAELTTCRATMEANFISQMGIPTLGIATGSDNPHSIDEHIAVVDLEGLGAFLAAIVEQSVASQ